MIEEGDNQQEAASEPVQASKPAYIGVWIKNSDSGRSEFLEVTAHPDRTGVRIRGEKGEILADFGSFEDFTKKVKRLRKRAIEASEI